MTTEELLARIAQLEAENEALKSRQKRHVSIREKFGDDYPFVRKMMYFGTSDQLLTKLVRYLCFPKTIKFQPVKGHPDKKCKTDHVISYEEMSMDQLNLFYEICGKIINVLSEYEVISKEME